MILPKKCIAINAWFGLALLLACAFAQAGQLAGTVINLSGPLLARKADGSVKILAQKSEVEQGDTLVSEKNTYARIKFIDNGEITLQPNTQFKIESFSYDAGKPESDSASFNLIKGGLRSITGLLGKRSKDRFGVKTPTATIGIRGTTFIAQYVGPLEGEKTAQLSFSDYNFASMAALAPTQDSTRRTDAPLSYGAIAPLQLAQNNPAPGPGDGPAPGLYVQVIDGAISLVNEGGAQNFAAGQFGYSASLTQPPVVLPDNPGIKFAPPPAFSSTSGPQAGSGAGASASNVDCEVR